MGMGFPWDGMGWDSDDWQSHETKLIVIGIPWDKARSLENKSAKKIANFLLEILGF